MADITPSDSTSSTSAPPPTTVKVTKRWADEEDDVPEEPTTASTVEAEKLNIEKLKIDEDEEDNKLIEQSLSLDEPEDINITAVTPGQTPYTSASKFEDLNLTPEILKGLYVEMGFHKPSKIQAISLPMILTPPNKDLIAQAHNGSGKTTCFVLGMLSRVDPKINAPQALCICPTRELALQNIAVLQKMGKYTGITSEAAVPSEKAGVQRTVRPPVSAHVVIGTPGTIKKLMSLKKLGVSTMKILVFDEADHMLSEDGFKDDSLRIMRDIQRVSPQCQVLLFSATFNDDVKAFVSRVTKEGSNQLFVKKEDLTLESLKQFKVNCPDELSKILVIKNRIMEFGENMGQTIIFVRTKKNAFMLHKALVDFGYEVTTIQGALGQEERDKIVKEFKDGLTQVLISTDVLARGFDQQQVNLVINFDLPIKYTAQTEPDCELYLHRIGRAGRFGRKGAAFNLLCGSRDEMVMSKIEQHFGITVPEVPRWDSDEDFKAALKHYSSIGIIFCHHVEVTSYAARRLIGTVANRDQIVCTSYYSTMVQPSISNERMMTPKEVSEGSTGGGRRHQIGENVSRKDKLKFLMTTLREVKDSKEAVYGALDAWVAWEQNFPIASLKTVIITLENEQQWHRVVQVIKWILSKGQGNTMGTYGQLIRALDKDHRADEAHNFWMKKIGTRDLHSVPWQLCKTMICVYYRNNMLERLVKLFKGLEAYDRKPPEKVIVQRVADAYEMLGLPQEKERVMEKYKELFAETRKESSKKSKKGSPQPREPKNEGRKRVELESALDDPTLDVNEQEN
ncbi:hypothetical protein ACFE04_001129 [Oxalis oulophora]